MDVPTLTVEQMRDVDAAASAEYGISTASLMEHAGYQIAAHVREHHLQADRIHVYCGAGNNGGDGMVAARRLASWGFDVLAILASRNLSGLPAEQLWALERSDASIADAPSGDPDVVVDALLGTGLHGDPQEPYAVLIETVNDAWADTIAVDVPSGVDADTGEPAAPHVDADTTITFGLPKQGLLGCDAAGQLVLADIGLPPGIYARFDIEPPQPFSRSSRVHVSDE